MQEEFYIRFCIAPGFCLGVSKIRRYDVSQKLYFLRMAQKARTLRPPAMETLRGREADPDGIGAGRQA